MLTEFNPYKTILSEILAPICGIRFTQLESLAWELREETNNETKRAVAKMILRARSYIEMTLTVLAEEGDEKAIEALSAMRKLV